MGTLLVFLSSFVRAMLRPRGDLAVENAALRQQLACYLRRGKLPKLRPADRFLWVLLARVWAPWRSALAFVQPATVIRWHRQGFRLFWRWKSRPRRVGRPRIPEAHIALIRRISKENPSWGEDRIADELRLKLGIVHSPSTIRKYMVRSPEPRRSQTWRQFVANHGREVFACDFLVQHTARFEVVYVFVVMELESRSSTRRRVQRSPG